MKLPTDYQMTSLADLRTQVTERINIATDGNDLEMTEEQYIRYKTLVWREDPMRFYNGMEIKISTEDATKTGDGSV